jgi:hypothetical protein
MNVSDAGPQTKLDPEPDTLVAAMQELARLMRQTVPELDDRGLIMAGYVLGRLGGPPEIKPEVARLLRGWAVGIMRGS